MRAKLAYLNHCAVLFLSLATANLFTIDIPVMVENLFMLTRKQSKKGVTFILVIQYCSQK